MSKFTEKEIEYIKQQRLGRLATINAHNEPQIAPVTFRFNAELDAIEIGGRNMSQSKKFRNILANPNVSFVIDDVLPPWQPRGIEIRGSAETVEEGGKEMFGPNYTGNAAIIRIRPRQIIGWGLDSNAYEPFNRKV